MSSASSPRAAGAVSAGASAPSGAGFSGAAARSRPSEPPFEPPSECATERATSVISPDSQASSPAYSPDTPDAQFITSPTDDAFTQTDTARTPSSRPARPSAATDSVAAQANRTSSRQHAGTQDAVTAWREPMDRARLQTSRFIVAHKKRNRGDDISDSELERHASYVRDFLAYLEQGLHAPRPDLKRNNIDKSLRSLHEEEHRAYVPADISSKAEELYHKLEQRNWGAPADPATAPTAAAAAAAVSAAAASTTAAAAAALVAAHPPAPVAAPVAPVVAPLVAPVVAHPAAAAAPAANAIAAGAATNTRLPPPNHPIWGVNGIMHGLARRRLAAGSSGYQYIFDPRYLHQRRDARVTGANGLAPGAWWPLQRAAVFAGAHGQTIKGISGSTVHGAYSVVVSGHAHGPYADLDEDHGNVVHYSSDRPVPATITSPSTPLPPPQSPLWSADTRALLISQARGTPVRVLRSAGHGRYAPVAGIRYDGLYRVVSSRRKRKRRGAGAGQVYLVFRLVRVAGQAPTLDQICASSPTRGQLRDERRMREGY